MNHLLLERDLGGPSSRHVLRDGTPLLPDGGAGRGRDAAGAALGLRAEPRSRPEPVAQPPLGLARREPGPLQYSTAPPEVFAAVHRLQFVFPAAAAGTILSDGSSQLYQQGFPIGLGKTRILLKCKRN